MLPPLLSDPPKRTGSSCSQLGLLFDLSHLTKLHSWACVLAHHTIFKTSFRVAPDFLNHGIVFSMDESSALPSAEHTRHRQHLPKKV
jgi:hypothetical protein